jgi:hypothetical protein
MARGHADPFLYEAVAQSRWRALAGKPFVATVRQAVQACRLGAEIAQAIVRDAAEDDESGPEPTASVDEVLAIAWQVADAMTSLPL